MNVYHIKTKTPVFIKKDAEFLLTPFLTTVNSLGTAILLLTQYRLLKRKQK